MNTRPHSLALPAAARSPRVFLEHGGFWIGSRDSSRDSSPAFVRVTPFNELSESTLRTLREWAR